jgi:hypothetical protein
VHGSAFIVPTGTDNVGIFEYKYYLGDCVDGHYLGGRIDSSRWSWNWDAGGLPKGNYGLCVKALDAAGNSTNSATILVVVQ